MRILVISSNYPSTKNPSYGVFVYNLVQKFFEMGHDVKVISPMKFWHCFKKTQHYGHEMALVFRPLTLSFSAKRIGHFNTYTITRWFSIKAIKNILSKHKLEYDVVYCHFLRNAFNAIEALGNSDKPIIAAVGENKGIDQTNSWLSNDYLKKSLQKIDRFIVVSEQVKNKLLALQVNQRKIIVEPNATDLNRFFKGDKQKNREKHGIPNNKFVVLFTGNFIESKGPHRLLRAIENLDHVVVMYIGGGPLRLESDQIVFKSRVPNNIVPGLLNCADAFVLPTLHEGSNNSIIEAMACGLPIVSSDIPEVRSQCDPSFSILVDPKNISDIRKAILYLSDNPGLCETMSANAVQWSKKFDLNKRTERILNYMGKMIKEDKP